MAGGTPNSQNIDLIWRAAQQTTFLILHPEWYYYHPEWVKIRDAIQGEREIKRKGIVYLNKSKTWTKDDYKEYLDGAVFFNMTAQTLNGMTGPVFRRAPALNNFPKALDDQLPGFSCDGSSHVAFAKTVLTEQLALGRYGVLVDAPANSGESYCVGYRAEDILDWNVERIKGQYVLNKLILREWVRLHYTEMGLTAGEAKNLATKASATKNPYTWPYFYIAKYRELLLDDEGLLQVNIYEQDPSTPPVETYFPNIRGNRLDYIPFVFFGATGNSPSCEKSPLLDIVNLNLSHYKTYAELEYGRRYTGLPTYYAPGNIGEGASEYHIGPGVVWEVPQGCTPGIIEFKADGLKSQERALSTKEGQIAAIGGRLLPGQGKGVSLSDNQSAIREASEQSLLLSAILACNEGMSLLLRYWAAWRDVPMEETANLKYVVNLDFLAAAIGARELRAIQMMYADGLLPIDTFYDYLRKAEVLDEDVTLEQFAMRMRDPNAFLNNPDVQAKQRGYETRQQELDQEARVFEEGLQERQIELEEEQLDIESGQDERQADLDEVELKQQQLALKSAQHDLVQKKKAASKPAVSPLATPTVPQPTLAPPIARNLQPGAPPKPPQPAGVSGNPKGAGKGTTVT